MGAKGNYLFRGDKTVCGGRIIEGCPDHQHFDKDMACEGHKVTCGKHAGHYRIVGGLENDDIHGKRVAGTLHSRSSCPCKSRFIPSNFEDDYELESQSTTTNYYHKVEFPVLPGPIEPKQYSRTAKKKRTGVDAGFCVVPQQSTTESFESILFAGAHPEGTRELYRSLNGTGKEYKAGSILLLVDPDNPDDEQIAHMQKAKTRVDAALAPLTHEEANFLHEHYATIANFSNIADKGIGLAADPVGKYFENIEKILKEIQETYKNTYITRGALIGEQFYVRRTQLFTELDRVLKVGFLNKAMKFGEYTKIKNALGLSSSSITHKWNETGVSDIEGYATHIERAAKYTTAMRYTGYVGIAFSAVHSINEINEACSTGREAECAKKKYTEIGSFTGGLAGGYAGGAIGMGLCTLILGGATVEVGGAGALACGVILGTGGGYWLGQEGSDLGQSFGDSIYESVGK